jgi:hypothetical protein
VSDFELRCNFTLNSTWWRGSLHPPVLALVGRRRGQKSSKTLWGTLKIRKKAKKSEKVEKNENSWAACA